MILGAYLGKPTQLRPLQPVTEAAHRRGWTVHWYGPGARETPRPPWDLPAVMVSPDPPVAPCPWIWLQTGMDPFHDPALAATEATVAVYTDWWLAQLPPGVRGVAVGFPLATRAWPMPPMLVYVPFSVRSGSPSRWQRLQNSWAHRQFIRSLGWYLEATEQVLRVKVRDKDPIPRSLRARAAQVVTDHQPVADTLDWLAGATGCLHVYSSVVLEAAALGVPSLCLDPGPEAFRPAAARFCHGRPGGLFHWPGVAEYRRLTHPWEPPPRWRIDPDALREYRACYLGPTGEAAERVCDLAEKLR